MIKVENKIIPLKRFTAMIIAPFIFIRSENINYYTSRVDRHEHIHAWQQLEMLVIGVIINLVLYWVLGCGLWSFLALPLFLWWYCIEWLVRLIVYWDRKKAYRSISFEREAYINDVDPDYLDHRNIFAWVKYIIN